ncbi:MAG: hypothetical protein ACI89L_001039 [Phycisphaerales bacterium]|jgi:hypothetical protein
MIRITCDNCERTIEADDLDAGGKVSCPDCGDVNRVPEAIDPEEQSESREPANPKPASGKGPGGADRASAAGLPPDHGPELQVVKVRRCWFRSRPLKFSLVVLLTIAGFAGLIYGGTQEWPGWTKWLWLALSLGSMGVLGWWWVDRLESALEITNKRTISHRGLFSRSTSEVVHDNIRNVQVDQSFWQRLWGVGRLGISSSGQDGVEIQVNHLKKPNELREMIDLYRPLD